MGLLIRALLTLLLGSIALFGAQPSFAQGCIELHVIKNRPLGYIDDTGQPTGIHWEFLNEVESRSGLCIHKKLMPYPRVWKSIQFGKHDGGIVFRSPDRDELVEYVAPVFTVRTVVIPRKGLTLERYDDLYKIIIGKVRGTKLGNRFDEDTELMTLELHQYDQVVGMIKRGRIDAMAGSGLGLSILTELEAREYVDLDGKFILGERVQWLQLSKKSQHLDKLPQLQQAVKSLVEEGVFEVIMDKYHGPNWKEANQ